MRVAQRRRLTATRISGVFLLLGVLVFCVASFSLYWDVRCLLLKPSAESRGFGFQLNGGVAKFVISPDWHSEEMRFSIDRFHPNIIHSFGDVIYRFNLLNMNLQILIEIPLVGISLVLIVSGCLVFRVCRTRYY